MVLQKITKYCDYQDRSVAEVKAKLAAFLLPEKEIKLIISQLIEENYLNDERFTENFVNSKLNSKGWGYYKIRLHLKQKGISNNLIESVLNSINEENWNEELKKNINKWEKNNELNKKTFPKLVRFLTGKGYKLSEIMKNIIPYHIFM
jgi:regulatory protein